MTHDAPTHTNRLAGETSPYLLQHAHNPVDWYPWATEALERARTLDRPIFLSIGYAACHWCHVMERESFEDIATATDLNARFVAIKVDREERPDLDALYMDAVQAMTGQGGWPMSVFLTPDGRPFYGGTYFPNEPRHGMPSFRQVLGGVHEAWTARRADVEATATRLAQAVEHGQGAPAQSLAGGTGGVGDAGAQSGAVAASGAIEAALDAAVAALERSFDARHGGWGGPPRFPQAMTIELLLREGLRTGDQRPTAMARRVLDAMAAGGIHDHLGGGFARYATDSAWLVPHFEKMLYDNAQLARLYLHAWQLTGEPRYAEVARVTLDFAARELREPAGGAFAASLDADTGGEEGATYVWSAEEVFAALGDAGPLFSAAYGVTAGGNWEGHTILSRVRDNTAVAATFGLSRDEVAGRLADARERLLAIRDKRPQPARDAKVLASWNGLAVAAYAEAGRALPGGDGYTAIATEAADFLWTHLRGPDGRLRRSWKDDRLRADAVLEDHTHLADGFLAVYETTFDERWFVAGRELADVALQRFADPAGGFFDTADDAERLVARPRSLGDHALPSGNAMAAMLLLRLAALTGEGRYRDAAERAIVPLLSVAARYPTGFGQWLLAAQLALAPIDEIAIVGAHDDPGTLALLAEVRRGYRPWSLVAVSDHPDGSAVPLLSGRSRIDGRAAAWVCRGFACQRPVTLPSELAAQLSGVSPPA